MVETQIRVRGLRELARDLRAIDGGALGRELRTVNLRVAQNVVPLVRARYARRYPQVTGRGMASIRATASADRATVVIGGARAPYMPGQEFGSNRYPQFRPWTGKGPGGAGSRGRFLYPTIRNEVPDIMDEYADAIEGVLSRAFPAGGGR